MGDLTLDQLHQIMREVAGPAEEPADPGTDIGDVELAELGYDSLVVLETATRISRDFGVRLPDDVVSNFATLNEFVAYVSDVRAVG